MSDPYLTGEKYCAVYDEPQHRFHLRNAYTNIYEIELPPDRQTYFHRHCQDTVYFVIADAEVEESFQDKPTILTTAPSGGTLCRGHYHDPLIHQVKNIGSGVMHMVGAEALEHPPVSASEPFIAAGHTLSWESARFRVYDVAAIPDSAPLTYETFGLLVALETGTVHVGGLECNRLAAVHLKPGSFIWVEPGVTVNSEAAFRGIFAEWR